MPYELRGHHLHPLLHGSVGRNREHGAAHDRAHRRLPRTQPAQRELARVVALGEQAHGFAVLNHEQSPDPVIGHELQRIEYADLRIDGPNRRAFFTQDVPDAVHSPLPLSSVYVVSDARLSRATISATASSRLR